MGARGRRTLQDRTVASDPMVRAVSPEVPLGGGMSGGPTSSMLPPDIIPARPPLQLWDAFDGPPRLFEIASGHWDAVVTELYELGRRHRPEHPVTLAAVRRLAELEARPSEAFELAPEDHPVVKSFKGFKGSVG
jgi:hypothetical protein